MTVGRSVSRQAGHVLIVGDVIDDILVRPLSPTTVDSDTVARIDRRPGGSAANQAAWVSHCGGRVRFVGRVATQDVERHRRELARSGVEALLAPDHERPTGTIVILVGADGDRTMFTDRGANLGLCAADLPPDCLDGAALLHVNGYPLFEPSSRTMMLELMSQARAGGIDVSVDPCSAAFLRQVGAEDFLRWTAGAAVCFPNRDEGTVLTGFADPHDIVSALGEHYGLVVLKLGADGALVGNRRDAPFYAKAASAPVLDPTGTGDAFCGGFLAAWLEGATPAAATLAGSSAAALCLARTGARPRS